MKSLAALIVAVAALGLALAGCPKPTPVPVPPDASCADATCACACARGAQLGCRWATPTAAGATCETVCANANRVDGPASWNLACRVGESSCDACP